MKSINFYCDIILTSGNVEYLDPPVPPFYVTKNRMGKHSVVLQDELGYTTPTVMNSPYNIKIMLLLFEMPDLQIGPHNKLVISY